MKKTKSTVLSSCLEFAVTVTAVIPCPPSVAWHIITDIDRWPEMFRGCEGVERLGKHPTSAKLPRESSRKQTDEDEDDDDTNDTDDDNDSRGGAINDECKEKRCREILGTRRRAACSCGSPDERWCHAAMESVQLGERYRIRRIAKNGKRLYGDWTVTATSNPPARADSSCRLAFPRSATAYTTNLGSVFTYASSTWTVEEHVVPCSGGEEERKSATSCVVTTSLAIAPHILAYVLGMTMTRGAIVKRALCIRKRDMEDLEKWALLLMSAGTETVETPGFEEKEKEVWEGEGGGLGTRRGGGSIRDFN